MSQLPYFLSDFHNFCTNLWGNFYSFFWNYVNSGLDFPFNQGFPDHSLKEKLPEAFMQIGWMEDEFKNLTAKDWANLVNQSRDMIFQRFR